MTSVRHHGSIRKAAAVLLVLSAGCELIGLSGQKRDFVVVSGDEPFALELGQTAILEGSDASIRFGELLEDSRCPKGVDCVWAGQVRTAFELSDGEDTYPLIITGLVGGADRDGGLAEDVAGFRVVLRAVAPYPVFDAKTKRIKKSMPTAILTVTKQNS